MRPSRLVHSRRFRAASGSVRKNSMPPLASLLSSPQRVQAQPGGATAEGASARANSALVYIFTDPRAVSRGRQLD
jgi:hypothetical protein